MSYLSKMEDYLRHESSHDRLPEAYKVREIYNEKVEQLEKERDELRAEIKWRNKTLKIMMETVGDCNEDSKNMTIDWKQGAIWVYQNIEVAIEDARDEMRDAHKVKK